jgi:integrase
LWRPERRCPCRSSDGRGCRCPTERVRWRAGLRVNGKKISRTFATQREAKAWAAQQEADVSRGKWVDPRQGAGVLFKDWVPEWQATRSVLKPATRDADRSRLPRVLDAFGSYALTQIDALAVRQWVAELVDADCASKTIRHYHALLHGILDLAVTARLIHVNPCQGTRLPELVEREPVFLNEAEIAALINAHDDYWRPLPLLLAGTGLRWAEAVGLRPRYIDLARGDLAVRWTYSRRGWSTPKSKMSRRTIPLPVQVIEALRSQIACKEPDDFVFTMRTGSPLNEGYRSRTWRKAVHDAGLGAKAPRPHDLRHSHASLLIIAGVPLTVIQRRLGHQSIAVTSDVYGHLSRGAEQLAADAMSLALGLRVPDTVPTGL